MTMLQNGDCLDEMRDLADGCVDSIVTDPPYGLSFMGKEWDSFGSDTRQHGDAHYVTPDNPFGRGKVRYGYGSEFASSMRSFQTAMTPIFAEALRVAKPGAHLLAFGGTRTYHRLACAIEDAGWEIRDCLMWVYGSGFPKSMDVSKAIDKMFGAERTEVIGSRHRNAKPYDDGNGWNANNTTGDYQYMAPATTEAVAWNGWGTQLKPACEPIVIARKPLEGTVAANVLKYGTGAINIDGCRVQTENAPKPCMGNGYRSINDKNAEQGYRPNSYSAEKSEYVPSALGRFPANLIHDGSEEVLALFPDTGKSTGGRTIKRSGGGNVGSGKASEASWTNDDPGFGDSGSAARFFYCAKASRSERGEGNVHPTVKPIALMRYLVRLVTRKGGIVLDPFMGSGTTGIAAIQEGMNFIGIERDQHYYEIAQRRISQAKWEPEGPIQLDLFAQTEGEIKCS